MSDFKPDMNKVQLHGPWQKHVDKTYIGSHDLMKDDGSYTTTVVTITGIFKRKIFNPGPREFENKVVAEFQGKDKQMILNPTNMDLLSGISGTTLSDKWVGTRVKLTVEQVHAGKKGMVPAIRFAKPPVEKGEPS